MRSLTTSLVLALLVPIPGSAQARFERATSIGRVDSIRSERLDETRPYLVYVPPSYADSVNAPQRYPVLYLLDGDAHFHSVSGLIQILGTGVNATFVLPEMIVVAIPNTDRTRDLTPTHTTVGFDGETEESFATSGGGPVFLEFLRSELIPHIESRYRTLPFRTLVGHSFGGITVLNALYTMPETFNAYVAIDPSLWWDNRVLLHRAREFLSSARLDGRVLHVSQANTISPGDTARNLHFESIVAFDAIMKTYDRSGIRYAYEYYEGDDHGSVPLIAEYDALRFIFDGYALRFAQVISDPDRVPAHYRAVSERFGVSFKPPAQQLALLSQISLSRDTADAIRFGEMRIENYPTDARGYEFLGDAWAGRDVARARRYYEEALARNPESERIREKLEKLAGG